MFDRIERSWRVFGTGLSFFLFGLGGLLLRILVFPFLNLFVRNAEKRNVLSRRVIRASFILFIGIMRTLGVLRYSIKGAERLNREGLLIIANHPTLIDTIFLMSMTHNADCIIKSSLWRNPFTHGPVHAAGYIRNDEGAELIDDCIAALDRGSNLIIFPEGTRTPDDGIVRIKRGATNIAVRGKRNITPVIIRCTPKTLGKNMKWWRVPEKRVQFLIEVKEDIDISDFIGQDTNEVLAVRRLTDYVENFFNEENSNYGAT